MPNSKNRVEAIWRKLLACEPPPTDADLRDIIEVIDNMPSLQRKVRAELKRRGSPVQSPRLPALAGMIVQLLDEVQLSAPELSFLLRHCREPRMQKAAAIKLLSSNPSYTDLRVIGIKLPQLLDDVNNRLQTPRMLLMEELLNINCKKHRVGSPPKEPKV